MMPFCHKLSLLINIIPFFTPFFFVSQKKKGVIIKITPTANPITTIFV